MSGDSSLVVMAKNLLFVSIVGMLSFGTVGFGVGVWYWSHFGVDQLCQIRP